MADFSTAIKKKLKGSRMISSINRRKQQSNKLLYPAGGKKIAFKNEDEIRSFSDNEKPRMFTIDRASLEENAVHVLRAEAKTQMNLNKAAYIKE